MEKSIRYQEVSTNLVKSILSMNVCSLVPGEDSLKSVCPVLSKDSLLRCYVCGEALPEKFAIVFYGNSVDRVFLVHEDCSSYIDSAANTVVVEIRS